MKRITPMVLLCALVLPACSPLGLATGAGAAVGVSAAREGGISGAWTDTKIQAQINELWFSTDVEMFRKLDLTVNQGRVLITGVVQNPEHRVEAVRLAWQPAGVKQVINEIRVADSAGITGFARDTWITTRLRTAITFDRAVQSINYSIDTVQGTVYLMGVAQNQAELNRVIETARTIPDVRQVVSYVKLAGVQEDAGQNTPAWAPPPSGGPVPLRQNPPEDPSPYDNRTYDSGQEQPYGDDFYDPPPGRPGAVDGRTYQGGAGIKPVERETIHWNEE